MSQRKSTIALSEQEKSDLDQIAEDAFGEADTIPYGVTVSMLIDAYRDDD
jgi:hypothetical protein